jgi:hypothetical protein
MFGRTMVRRLLPHGIVFFVAWPLASTLAGTLDLKSQPMTSRLPWITTFEMLLRAQPQLVSEWLVVALLGGIASTLIFAALSRIRGAKELPTWFLAIEPLLLMLATVSGIATEYPAVLAHPFLQSLRIFSVRLAILTLVGFALGLFFLFGLQSRGLRGGAVWVATSILLVALAAFVSRAPAARRKGVPSRRSIVLLGIDSLSQRDDLGPLRDLAQAQRGMFASRAVTTGVVTNAVWGSILQHRPIREIGTWTIFMTTSWRSLPFNLVRSAHDAGLTTVSYFSDQFTSYIGSEAGFDIDRSGPMGWFQLATATLKHDSVFLAVALPRLPKLPGARTPRNQSGTFTFDVSAELDDLLSSPPGSGKTFSAGHLDYLHQPLYPRFDELTPGERRAVLASPVTAVEDLSFDWRYPSIQGDSLGLYRWKARHVQDLVRSAVVRTGFLEPSRLNRLILFSDHGSRKDLTGENFGNPSYWNVLLATFGTAADDPSRPISLLEIPKILGLADPTRPAFDRPEVEFADVGNEDIPTLTPYFSNDGRIFLDPGALARIRRQMKAYRPYAAPGLYFSVPVQPPFNAADRRDTERSSHSNK